MLVCASCLALSSSLFYDGVPGSCVLVIYGSEIRCYIGLFVLFLQRFSIWRFCDLRCCSLSNLRAPLSPLEHLNLNCQARLEGMRARLLSKSGALLNLSADSATLASTQPAVEAFVKALPEAPSASEVCA